MTVARSEIAFRPANLNVWCVRLNSVRDEWIWNGLVLIVSLHQPTLGHSRLCSPTKGPGPLDCFYLELAQSAIPAELVLMKTGSRNPEPPSPPKESAPSEAIISPKTERIVGSITVKIKRPCSKEEITLGRDPDSTEQ